VPVTTCPACGEAEQLAGTLVGDDIEVTCQACGARWMRGAPRCKTCGGAESISVQQRMTRHPRGTLLSVVGMREVPLCRTCDREVLDTALSEKRSVPEGYVSRFLFDAATRKAVSDPSPPRRVRPAKPARARTVAPPPRPAPAVAETPSAPGDPTLRQAVEAYLGQVDGPTDSVALVLLGSELGSSVRLSTLDSTETAGRLADWVQRIWGSRADQRDRAVATLRGAFDYWRDQGWIGGDLGEDLPRGPS